jgi:hypothetical protein
MSTRRFGWLDFDILFAGCSAIVDIKIASSSRSHLSLSFLHNLTMELNAHPSLAKVEELDTEEDPNEQDLCEVIIMIKDRFPRLKLGCLIKVLHDNLVR